MEVRSGKPVLSLWLLSLETRSVLSEKGYRSKDRSVEIKRRKEKRRVPTLNRSEVFELRPPQLLFDSAEMVNLWLEFEFPERQHFPKTLSACGRATLVVIQPHPLSHPAAPVRPAPGMLRNRDIGPDEHEVGSDIGPTCWLLLALPDRNVTSAW